VALKTLITAAEIAERVRQLGVELVRELERDAGSQPPLVLALLDGSFCFVADLVRAMPIEQLECRFLRASSYGQATISSGTVTIERPPDCAGRDVVIVDDILDTGRTLSAVCAEVRRAGARRVLTCVLLDKPARRVPVGGKTVAADFRGFTIADLFVVGYGLDFAGRYRHLPDVCVYEGV
jgi:hypoxanthine phosphoribosyltransferase